LTLARGCSTPPDGMAVVANWMVKEDRKADQQNPDGHVVSSPGYQRVAFENTEASTDHDHDGRESSPRLSLALSQPPTRIRLGLSHSMVGQAQQ
jgi:hypothetical protein